MWGVERERLKKVHVSKDSVARVGRGGEGSDGREYHVSRVTNHALNRVLATLFREVRPPRV
jgi:hypothetical protein